MIKEKPKKTTVHKEKPPVKKVEKIEKPPVIETKVQEIDEVTPEDFPTEKELASKPDRYFEAIGRRKTAVARVRLFTRGEKQFLINGKNYVEYFPLKGDQETAVASMKKMKCLDKFKVTVIVKGGGRNAYTES